MNGGKRDQLLRILSDLKQVAVALSGGVDSAVVAKAAFEALGGNAVAVTADSPSVARADLDDAMVIAHFIGIRHVVLKTNEFRDANYLQNDGRRCYFCKSELYSVIESNLKSLNAEVICSGANLDDMGDYRPGLIAAAEHRVRHPLQEAGFTKADVRELARFWNLPVWDKPASPCLSSRIAPGVAVTVERTSRVEQAETFLKQRGIRVGRVRLHEGELARIEVHLDDVAKLTTEPFRGELAGELLRLGFRYVTLDLAGFRSGNLNDLIPLEIKVAYSPRTVPA